MGCDIHAYTEIKDKTNQNWFLAATYYQKPNENKQYQEMYLGRDYLMFAQLANVRNYDDQPVISMPRDLPRDCSDEVRQLSNNWGIDGHSHSYLTLGELKDWIAQHPTVQYEDDHNPEPNPINRIIKHINQTCALFEMDNKCTNINDIRIVFWFDN
jgi:hypothetical protein